MYLFTTPTYELKPVHGGRLLSRYRFNNSISVVKYGSTYEEVITPAVGLWDVADEVYLGGHVYEVSDEEAALLTAAGYGDYLTVVE